MRFSARLLIILGALLSLQMTPAQTMAQGLTPCEPDCHDKPFEGPFYLEALLPAHRADGGLCNNWFQIEYYYRQGACDQFDDVQITMIRLTGVPDSSCSTAYTNLPDIFKAAVAALIRDNPMGFAPRKGADEPAPGDPPVCSTKWRVSAGVCWRIATPPEYGVRSCDPLCCLQSFRVCLDPGGTVSWSPIGMPNGGGMCTSTFGAACTPVCEYLNAVGELPDAGN